ncbi:MAG TPA: toast rack family protein [Bryobacteraceae bacterium]|nr:toast rack family protein [Bryobacteraceae bacterium]
MINRHSVVTAICAAFALSACNVNVASNGPEQHESHSVDLDKSEKVHARFKMPMGDLKMSGGADKLMDADFNYNVAAWKPDIRYTASGNSGDLVVEQNGPKSSLGGAKNRWDMRLNDSVPMDLDIQFGAGDADLKFGSMNLRGLNLEMGAGDLRLDLRGTPKKDYSVRVRGGAGDATIYLPRGVGISAIAKGGLGDVSVQGLHKSGDRYVNDANETAAVRVDLDIQGGVGSISLNAE